MPICRTVPIALLGAALCAGCDPGAPEESNASSPGTNDVAAHAAAGVLVPLLEQNGMADAVLTEGVLHVDGPCLYVTNDSGARERIMPAFTVPVSWDARENVLVAGENRMKPGEQVWLSGGRAASLRATAWLQAPHPFCDASNIYVSNDISPIGAISARKQEQAPGRR